MNMLNKQMYFVINPTNVSTLADICFVSDFQGLEKQFLGGLKSEDIVGVYDNESEAKEHAEKLLTFHLSYTYEKFVKEFVLGRGYFIKSLGFMTGAEVQKELDKQGGQKYANVYYEKIETGV